jgi:UDP-N-acetylmuramoyl-tripeptide--D-alanyl-D-alanine ligase
VELHRDLAESIVENSVDLVFCAGSLYQAFWEALPSGRRGSYAVTAAALEPEVLGAVRAGDAVMVKGSLGSKMGPIVKALTRQFSSHDARAVASAQG